MDDGPPGRAHDRQRHQPDRRGACRHRSRPPGPDLAGRRPPRPGGAGRTGAGAWPDGRQPGWHRGGHRRQRGGHWRGGCLGPCRRWTDLPGRWLAGAEPGHCRSAPGRRAGQRPAEGRCPGQRQRRHRGGLVVRADAPRWRHQRSGRDRHRWPGGNLVAGRVGRDRLGARGLGQRPGRPVAARPHRCHDRQQRWRRRGHGHRQCLVHRGHAQHRRQRDGAGRQRHLHQRRHLQDQRGHPGGGRLPGVLHPHLRRGQQHHPGRARSGHQDLGHQQRGLAHGHPLVERELPGPRRRRGHGHGPGLAVWRDQHQRWQRQRLQAHAAGQHQAHRHAGGGGQHGRVSGQHHPRFRPCGLPPGRDAGGHRLGHDRHAVGGGRLTELPAPRRQHHLPRPDHLARWRQPA